MQRILSLNWSKFFALVAAIFIFLTLWGFSTIPVFGISYSSGTYGTCTYGSCSISLTTSGTIAINVTPAGGTKCTVSNDTVTATTDASTGYTVTLNDSDTSNALNGPTSIAGSSATPASPATLSTNTWGYRIDTIAGFGAGPTSSVSNGSVPSQTFAGIPISTDTPGLVRTTNTADTGTVSTSVWYGVCADASLQNGSYTDNVTYTAVVN